MSAARPPVQRADDAPGDVHRRPSVEHVDPTWGETLWFFVQRMFLYFVFYALSIGPLYWHWYRAQYLGGPAIVAAFYIPLRFLAELIPPFGAWLDWYVGFWIT